MGRFYKYVAPPVLVVRKIGLSRELPFPGGPLSPGFVAGNLGKI